jgi:hypothetical protein
MSEFFTKKPTDTWLRFAKEINGTFIEGNSWESNKAIKQYNDFEISFDNYKYMNDITFTWNNIMLIFFKVISFVGELY